MTRLVAWGVTSRGVRPVPPVVTTSGWRATPLARASAIASSSSATTMRSTSKPSARSRASSRAPDSSSRTPWVTPSLAVRTRALRVTVDSAATLAADATGGASPWLRARTRTHVGGSLPCPALAARLGDQADALDLDAALDPLDHVVDGQRRDRGGGHRLHLDAGLGRGGRLGADAQHARGAVRCHRDDQIGQRQRMAERDELAGSLAAHDTRQLRHTQDIALRAPTVDD